MAPTRVFQLQPASLPNGEFAAAWFDDERALWDDDRLRKAGSLLGDWNPPRLQLFRPEHGSTDVLFNPNALAVSVGIREQLQMFAEIEFLPLSVVGLGMFFLLHVTATVEVSPEFSVRRAPPPSANIVELFAFPIGFTPSTAFFRVRQPADCAAGRAGYCLRSLYMSEAGARVLEATCGAYLNARAIGRDASQDQLRSARGCSMRSSTMGPARLSSRRWPTPSRRRSSTRWRGCRRSLPFLTIGHALCAFDVQRVVQVDVMSCLLWVTSEVTRDWVALLLSPRPMRP